MRWARGFFRIWVVAAVLWVGAAGFFAHIAFQNGRLTPAPYQHVMQALDMPWAMDWNKQLPEIAYRPMQGPRPETFAAIEPEYLRGFDDGAGRGKLVISALHDGTRLYLSSEWSDAERDALTQEFWRQRWIRYLGGLLPFAAWGLGLPLASLVLGLLIRWALRGFRSTS